MAAHSIFDWIDRQAPSLPAKLVEWSNINSGSRNIPGLARMLDVLRDEFAPLVGDMRVLDVPKLEEIDDRANIIRSPLGQALSIRKRPDAKIQILLNIHYDTVFAESDPFQRARIEGDTCIGPGVVDAKGGILVLLTALRAFEQSDFADKIGWEILLNPDEEIGSPGSDTLLKESAKRNQLALLFEPARENGALVGARKGSGTYVAVIRGKAAHAGRDFTTGRSAILAAADLITRIDAINNQIPGVTINCGKITGGGATNIVADLAIARFNIRAETPDQQSQLAKAFDDAIKQTAKRDGITIQLTGGMNFPPKPLDPRSTQLLNDIITTAKELRLNLTHVPSGGASDGNKLTAAGLPVVDSLGPVGGALHSDREYVHLPSIAERAKVVALYLTNLASGQLQVP